MKATSIPLLILLLSLTACSERKPAGFPDLYPVTLQVTQGDTPLSDAVVTLRPTENGAAWSIGGTTDQNGRLELWTHGKFKGAPAGTFNVVVTKTIHENEEAYLEALAREDRAAANRIDVRSFSLVENRYASEKTTPLTIEISSKSRLIEIDVGPPVRIPREYLK